MAAVPMPGVVLDLKLDSISGEGKVFDDSPSRNDAVVTGSVTVVNDPEMGHCLNFPGGADFLTVNDPFPNNLTFSICLWVKPEALNDGFRGIIGKIGDGAREPSLWMAPANAGLHYDSFDESRADRKGAILDNFFNAAGEWVHICWVNDGATYWFNKNGSLFTNAPAVAKFYRAGSGYQIGGIDNYFKGRIARVRIFDKPIGPGELAQVIAEDRAYGSAPQPAPARAPGTPETPAAEAPDSSKRPKRRRAPREKSPTSESPEALSIIDDAMDAAIGAAEDSADGPAGVTAGIIPGAGRVLADLTYKTCYAISYGVVFPSMLVAKTIPKDNPLVHGLVDGARAAIESVDEMKARHAFNHSPPSLAITAGGDGHPDAASNGA